MQCCMQCHAQPGPAVCWQAGTQCGGSPRQCSAGASRKARGCMSISSRTCAWGKGHGHGSSKRVVKKAGAIDQLLQCTV